VKSETLLETAIKLKLSDVAKAAVGAGADASAGLTCLVSVEGKEAAPDVSLGTWLILKGATIPANNQFAVIVGILSHLCDHDNITDFLKMLLQAGVNLDQLGPDGTTAMMKMCTDNREPAIQLLLIYGADVNAKDVYGKTALFHAVHAKHADIVTALLKAGADAAIAAYDGSTVIMEIEENDRLITKDIMDHLLQITGKTERSGADTGIGTSSTSTGASKEG
jgi:hypothetical protein